MKRDAWDNAAFTVAYEQTVRQYMDEESGITDIWLACALTQFFADVALVMRPKVYAPWPRHDRTEHLLPCFCEGCQNV